MTYTHTACRPQTGYRTRTVALAGHRDTRGKVHAITGTDYRARHGVGYRVYLTACGDALPHDDDVTDSVTPAADQVGTGVTCRKCRAAIRAGN